MDEQCLVLSGAWVCGDGGNWDFVIEKHRMGRMVAVYDGIGCKELEANVLREFGVDDSRFGVALSYWPPTSLELATGIKTPPVLITSDGTVKYFCKHLKVKGGMNLFAHFTENPPVVDSEFVDDSGLGFVTPDVAKFSTGSSKRSYVSSAASKTKVINLVEDEEFVREIERVEKDVISGVTVRGESSVLSSGGNDEGDVLLDEIELRPRGYDEEFWKPLLEGDYKGSNAVNVVFNEEEILAGLNRRSGPRTYADVGGSRGGDSNGNTPKPEDYNPWMGDEVREQVVYPPMTKLQPGRRRKARKTSIGEFRAPKKKESKNRCGRCGGFGHNRTNCVRPI
ncbi:Uncharacterized protein Rs2_39176 [Raphanus sativus]|nr:Uncharacterized protein Rs2_39176 [Raphanus sativus]